VKGKIAQLEGSRKRKTKMNMQVNPTIEQTAQLPTYQPLYSQPHSMKTTPWSVSTRTATGDTLTIRSAVAADAVALAAVGGKGFAAVHQIALSHEEMQGALLSSWSEKSLAEWIANPEIQILVAQVEQQIVGLAALNPTYRPSFLRRPTPVELCRFYVHLDWIGCGVGSKLMTQALHQAALTSYGLCWLRVWQGNKSAIQFYRRWGFTTISADDYAVGTTLLPVWVMVHPLS
jgi:GNAT superfamily N-acetyltransferase